jgi:hypothetical protein
MSEPRQWWDPAWAPPEGVIDKSRRLQQELWRRRLAAARSRHTDASAELRRVMEANSPESDLQPDGWQGVLEARFAEADALSDYIEALKVYSAFLARAAAAKAQRAESAAN